MYDFKKVFGIENNGSPLLTEHFGNTRICIITDELIRIENQPDRKFCDFPTQAVICRSYASPEYKVKKRGCTIIITTSKAEFVIMNGTLTKVTLADGRIVTDFKKGNLKGTRRTLDMTSGKVSLNDGVISKNGVALIDDSNTLLLLADGSVKPRKDVLGRSENGSDIYCFAYGFDYNGAVRDYYRLTGMTPLIPRFALGNWWSRYKEYSQEEYLELMEHFKAKKIPITVATIDMDWHYTDIKERFGKEAAKATLPSNPIDYIKGCYAIPGWTGYTWNEDLFPDYKEFLNKLHSENYKITLNLHPAQGVRCYESAYKAFAEFMGINPESKQQIEFDITDPKFTEGYFRFLHHGYENDGVDFWWLDWQQGNKTKIDGLDPLWALNHYHSLDMKRDGTKRPLTLSRFAGAGSHRYPLGFSGDTDTNWATLKFQPYFTATASNIGYSWWSHDIGGHHFGKRDDELYLRWVQFGVFSPIMRLHSTKNEFTSKEPWKFSGEVKQIVTSFMQLRHSLIPYLYSMNRRTSVDGVPLMRPMYYDYPTDENAYCVPNEYLFGDNLIACPITEKCDSKLRQGGTDVWLPDGIFTDIFTGRVYNGGRKLRMYRDLCSIPVLAKEGAIIPLSENNTDNNWKNPENIKLLIFNGNGNFKLYEDDGETEKYINGEFAETLFEVKEENEKIKFTINPTKGDLSVIPKARNYTLVFKNIKAAETELNREKSSDDCLVLKLKSIKPDEKVTVTLTSIVKKENPSKQELITELISKIQGINDLKSFMYTKCLKSDFNGSLLAKKAVREAVNEIMCML